MDVLVRIKHLLVRRRFRFSVKAYEELDMDGLEPADAIEAVLNAQSIRKVIRSHRRDRPGRTEKLYVIENFNFQGTLIYTKGKIAREHGQEIYYFFVSSKRARYGP